MNTAPKNKLTNKDTIKTFWFEMNMYIFISQKMRSSACIYILWIPGHNN